MFSPFPTSHSFHSLRDPPPLCWTKWSVLLVHTLSINFAVLCTFPSASDGPLAVTTMALAISWTLTVLSRASRVIFLFAIVQRPDGQALAPFSVNIGLALTASLMTIGPSGDFFWFPSNVRKPNVVFCLCFFFLHVFSSDFLPFLLFTGVSFLPLAGGRLNLFFVLLLNQRRVPSLFECPALAA